MRAIIPRNATHRMRAPKSWNSEAVGAPCDDLFTIVAKTGDVQTITSIWKPDAAELAALNAGHGIMLMIVSNLQPPVMIDVTGEPVS
jgi:hypothetical protein